MQLVQLMIHADLVNDEVKIGVHGEQGKHTTGTSSVHKMCCDWHWYLGQLSIHLDSCLYELHLPTFDYK